MSHSAQMPLPTPKQSIFDITLHRTPGSPTEEDRSFLEGLHRRTAELDDLGDEEEGRPSEAAPLSGDLEKERAGAEEAVVKVPEVPPGVQLPGVQPAAPLAPKPGAEADPAAGPRTRDALVEVAALPGPDAERGPRRSFGDAAASGTRRAPFFSRRTLMAALAVGALGAAALTAWLWPRPPATPPVAQEIPQELRAYHARAEAGDVAAMRMLGLSYCYGIGTPADPREGTKWLRKAADLGNLSAKRELKAMGASVE